ncbi:MAG TPA: hypothetical protein VL123_05225 [Candidatus Udaeobacter sp.]|jgi:hypothetical protein|nr:hypothetical protein [Candidatus Udaeobacter sp.]
MLHIDGETFLPFLVFAVPIVAIVGGITAGIVRTLGNQRLMELAQRERIAAIERGIDPAKLPPLPVALSDRTWGGDGSAFVTSREYAHRRYQGILIGGLVCSFVGAGLGVFLGLVNHGEEGVWAVGLIPGSVGVALLIAALIIRPRGDDGMRPPAPPSA